MNRFALGLIACALMLIYACVGFCAAAPDDSRPNIVLAIADDWSFPHASIMGDPVVKTPTFDRVAREGVLFTRAFCAAPTCSASRAAILTGQAPHRLAEGANLWGTLPAKFAVYPDILEKAGYYVGFERKGWGPGSLGGRKRNPAGNNFASFDEFFKNVPAGKPFCYWFGSHDPHRPYRAGQGAGAGLKEADVVVPAYLPDSPQTRNDILDYYFAVQRYDRESGHILNVLEDAGKLDNTLFVMTGDNGWPFPRAKANLYDAGTHVPLAVRWPARAKSGRSSDALISLADLAPTFLQAAGLEPLLEMTAKSFLPILVSDDAAARKDAVAAHRIVFTERERHANVRASDLSYPSRAIRTDKFLYIRNLRPDLWPAGDPAMWKAVGPFGDIDGGPTKDLLLSRRLDAGFKDLFKLACEKRPEEELFDLSKDPNCLNNVAGYSEYRQEQLKLRAGLDTWMSNTADPRSAGGGAYDAFDRYRYFGPPMEGPTTQRGQRGQ
jgi:N-sulfoglucosamine sulfohydrolase